MFIRIVFIQPVRKPNHQDVFKLVKLKLVQLIQNSGLADTCVVYSGICHVV